MAGTYGVYWRTEKDRCWTLALGVETVADAEQLKCRIMGMPRGRYVVERTTVIDFPGGGPLPTFVMVGREKDAPALVQARSYTPNWKPASLGKSKGKAPATALVSSAPPGELVYQRDEDFSPD